MGLFIMTDRAQMIGGTLDIISNPRSGTIVTCTFKQTPGRT
jgi:signal transduction histidine kinase